MSAADGWRSLSFEKKMTIVGAPLLIAVLSGLVISPLSNAISDRRTTRLEVVDLDVRQGSFREPPPPGETPGAEPADNYDPPVVELLVRNTGDLVSVVSGVQFQVTDHGLIAECPAFASGSVPVSASYDVVLPTTADAIGEVVVADVAQAIGPGEADRFAFRLTVSSEAYPAGTHIHELDVALERDGGELQEVGLALVSSLLPVDPDDLNLRRLDPATVQALGSVGTAHSACTERNRQTYDRFKARLGLPDLAP